MYDVKGNLVRDPNAMLILFQGDSITDNYRAREQDCALSSGYPTIVAGQASLMTGKKIQVLNRGISGDRIVDLLARWKRHCINLKPDLVSILIGVNDVWHEFDYQNGVDVEQYVQVYHMLVEMIRRELPKTQIVLMEPFLLHGHAVDSRWEAMSAAVFERAQQVQKIAEEEHTLFVPLQESLEQAAEKFGAGDITVDGVHPTALGHAVIAQQWLSVVFPEYFA